jgi:hypothetical protein
VTDTPGALQLRTQFCFLLVHVGADACARQGTDTRADERSLAALLGIVAGQCAEHRTGSRADTCALGGVVDLLFARVGVRGRAARDSQGRGHD